MKKKWIGFILIATGALLFGMAFIVFGGFYVHELVLLGIVFFTIGLLFSVELTMIKKKWIGFILTAVGALLFGMAFIVGNITNNEDWAYLLVLLGIIFFAIGLLFLVELLFLKIKDIIDNQK